MHGYSDAAAHINMMTLNWITESWALYYMSMMHCNWVKLQDIKLAISVFFLFV